MKVRALNDRLVRSVEQTEAKKAGACSRRLLAVAIGAGAAGLLVAGGLSALPGPRAPSIEVRVDVSERHQQMDGFGVEVDSSRWKGGELAPALDLLTEKLGASLFRVSFDSRAWEPANDNDDPNTFDWAYYGAAATSPRAEALWSTLEYLNQKGVTSGIVLCLVGPVPSWMGGTRVDVAAEDEWVEMVTSLVHYARVNRGLKFSRLAPLDQPDGDGRRGPRAGEGQTLRLLRKLARRLDADGLADVRLVAPLLLSSRAAVQRYIPRLLADASLARPLEAFAFDGDVGLVREAEAVLAGAALPRRKLWLSEGSPADASALQEITKLIEDLRGGGVTGVIFGEQERVADDSRAAEPRSLGPLSFDAASNAYGSGKAFAAFAQVSRFVSPGAVRIGAVASAPLPLVAFFDPAGRRVTVIGRNPSSADGVVSGTLAGLPQLTRLELYETDAGSADLERAADVSVAGGRFTARVSGNAIFTLTGTADAAPFALAGATSSVRRPVEQPPVAAPPTAKPAALGGLVAAYGFDEGAGSTAGDASGLGNTGTISGATWVTTGKYGKALSFNGTSSLVSVSDVAALHLTTGMTLEAWVQPTSVVSWRSVLLKETSNGLAYALYSSNDASRPAGFVHIGSDVDATGPAAIPLGAWTHLAATYDGAAFKLYVNGTQVTSRALSGSVATSTNPLRIGGDTIWGEYFAGLIDEVRIYNRALSAAEIQADMTTAVSGADTVPPTVNLTAPAAGSTVSGTVTVSATAADNVGVAGVQFLLDGVALGAEDTATPYSVSWNTSTATNGAHTLSARARDGSGNLATSAAVGVTVQGADATAPAVSITAPATGSTVSGTVTVSANASDNVGVAGVQFLLDGSALGAEVATAPYSVSWNTLSGKASVAAVTSATANLTVNAGQAFQTMAGMGTNVNVNNWNGGQLRPALDALVDVNGCSLLRVVRDPIDWVAAEADIAPLHALDPATLARIYEAPKMQDIWNTIGYLNQKGLGGKQLILNFMGWTPTWLGGSGAYGSPSYISAGKEPAFATMVASLVYYGRKVKGLDFTLLAPMNEEDWDAKEGPQVPAAQYVTVLKALVAELDAMGLSDVRLVGPDTAFTPAAYITAMMADATVAGRTDHLSFHTYGSATSPGSAYAGKDYWLTETGQWCSTCDQNGVPSQGEWGFARDTGDFFLQDLANGFAAVLVWEGYDGFYYHHNSYSTWGQLAYNAASGVYTPRKRLYTNGQLNAFIRPGARRVSVNTSLSGLTALAFYDAAKGEIAIVGHNSGGSAAVINGSFSNLPVAVTALALYETDSGSQNLQRNADVAVAAQAFSVSIPADTFFSLRSTAAATGGPHTLSARARDAAGNQTTSAGVSVTVQAAADTTPPTVSVSAPAAGSTVSGTVTVSATAADNVGVAGVQFLLDGVALGAEDTTTPYSIAWNTATATSGAHTLSARARDAAGNQTTSATVSVTVSNVVVSGGLVASYAFEEGTGTSVADASGHGNTGTISGATWVTTGKYGKALSFNGTSSLVSVSDVAALHLTTGMTLEAWVQPTSVVSWRSVLLKETSNGLAYALYSSNDASRPAGFVHIGSDVDATGPAAIPLGAWTHLAATYDGAAFKLYVNGTQVTSRALSGSVATSTNPLRIGGDTIWGEYFAGLIDEVRIYNRALSAAEVQTDMTTAVGVTGAAVLTTTGSADARSAAAGDLVDEATAPAEASVSDRNRGRRRDRKGLVAAYGFEEGAGSAIGDSSGLGNTGTVSNATWVTDGKFGRALSFDGATSLVTVNDTAALHLRRAMTLEAWVQPSAASARRSVLLKESPGGLAYALYASDELSRAAGYVRTRADVGAIAPSPIALNAWTHLAATYDGAAFRLYVDGAEVSSTPVTGAVEMSTNPLRLGGNSIWGEHYAGLIDEMRIYDRALSAAEIQVDMATAVDAAAVMAVPARDVALRLGRSPNFLIGMGNDLASDHNQDGAYTLGTTLDLHYAYLVGLQGQGGWPDWNAGGTFVNILADSADAHGVVPMFTLFSMAARGENNFSVLTDDSYMGPYWSGARLLFQRLAVFNKPAVVHLEPDFWAYGQQYNGNPAAIPVHVKAHAPECAALPDDLTGMGRCLLLMARQISPKVVTGFHVSAWAGATAATIAYMNAIGAGQADVVVVETLDRDAGCFEAGTDPNCQRGGTFYWDESNATSPNFREHLAWARALYDGIGLPLLWWQMPFGVPSATRGGTSGHYRDNRVHYVFSHVSEFVAAGGLGAAWGTGAGNQTYIDTDGNQFKNAVTAYFANPTPLPGADTAAPTVSVSAPAAGSTVSGTVTVSATAADNVGVAGVQFLLDGVALGAEDTTTPYSIAWNTATATSGAHTLSARARDAAGNQTTSTGVSVTVQSAADTTPPTVSVSAPAAGSTVSGTVTVSATAADNVGVAGVQFLLDGVALGAEDTTTPYSVAWNTATATSGAHTLSARARDAAGNQTTSATVSVTVSNVVVSGGLVASYAFEEGTGTTVADASGHGNTGTISGATWVTTGKYGKALSFNGTSSLVSVNDVAALHLTTGMTLEAWVQPTSVVSWRSVLLKETSNGLAYGLYSSNDASRPAGFVHIGQDVDATGPAAVVVGAWTHLAATYDGAAFKLYVNGTQVTSRALSGSVATSTNPLRIGGDTIWGEYFAGLIDEVRVYNRALSAAEVQADMSTAVGGGGDTGPPTVSLTAPTGGSTLSGTVTVSATAADNVGVAGVQFLLDGVALGAEDTTTPYSVAWNTATATSGAHTLSARARDAAGNQTTSAGVSVTVQAAADTTPPTVSVSAPAAGSTVSGTVTVSATAADNVGVAGVQFLLDGVALGAEDTTTPYSVAWNTATATSGVHTLSARARDAAGNQTTSTGVSVTVQSAADTAPPTVSVTSPAAGSTVSGTLTVSATAADNVGVAGVQFLLDGVALGAEDTTTPYSVAWNTATATSGAHTLSARARDAAGNQTTSATVSVTVSNVVVSGGLVASYAFEEGTGTSVADASGHGNTGTISGATWVTTGKYGKALSFNGTGSLVSVSDVAALHLTTGMTLEAWVQPTSVVSWRSVLLKETSNGLAYGLYSSNDASRPAGFVHIGQDVDATGPAAVVVGAWTHLATTYDGAAFKLYVNGTQVTSRALSGSIAASTNPLRIGGNTIWGEYFAGLIDEVRIYNRALSAAEVQADMKTAVGP